MRFTDASGRPWELAVDVAQVGRVRAECGVDLPGLARGDMRPLSELLMDPVRLAAVLHALCRPQADARGVSREDFARALSGDALQAAAEAFAESLFAFHPAATRPVLHRAARGSAETFDTRPAGLAELLDAAAGDVSVARRRVAGEG